MSSFEQVCLSTSELNLSSCHQSPCYVAWLITRFWFVLSIINLVVWRGRRGRARCTPRPSPAGSSPSPPPPPWHTPGRGSWWPCDPTAHERMDQVDEPHPVSLLHGHLDPHAGLEDGEARPWGSERRPMKSVILVAGHPLHSGSAHHASLPIISRAMRALL